MIELGKMVTTRRIEKSLKKSPEFRDEIIRCLIEKHRKRKGSKSGRVTSLYETSQGKVQIETGKDPLATSIRFSDEY